MSGSSTILFVETNILLRHKPLVQIDWLGLVREHGHPPDKEAAATTTVFKQADVLPELWTE